MTRKQLTPVVVVAILSLSVGFFAIIVWSHVRIADAVVVFGLVACFGAALLAWEIINEDRSRRRREPDPPRSDNRAEAGKHDRYEATVIVEPRDGGYSLSAGSDTEATIYVPSESPITTTIEDVVIEQLHSYLEGAPDALSLDDRRRLAYEALEALTREQVDQLAGVLDPVQEYTCKQRGTNHRCFAMARLIDSAMRNEGSIESNRTPALDLTAMEMTEHSDVESRGYTT